MRIFMPGYIAAWLFPGAVFRIRTTEKVLYLTFDDGPDPVSTPVILGILNKYKIRATFFCCGSRAEKNYDLIDAIKSQGNIIGNHGWNHRDGWVTSFSEYISDVNRADESTSSVLLRPPYGHLGIKQFNRLKKKYRIVFWDLMPYDFDRGFGSKKSLQVLRSGIRRGSVIVLHDSRESTCTEFLEEFIIYALSEGYRFDTF